MRSQRIVPTPVGWQRVREVLVRADRLTEAEFDEAFEGAVATAALGVQDLDWAFTHQLLSVRRSIPLMVHYEALAAAFEIPFVDIEGFHRSGIKNGVFSPNSLNRTIFYSTPPAGPLGSLLVDLGLVSQDTLYRVLGIQTVIRDALKVGVAIGSIFLALDLISYPDFYQALAIQAGIPYRDLNTSAAAVFDSLGRRIAARRPPGG